LDDFFQLLFGGMDSYVFEFRFDAACSRELSSDKFSSAPNNFGLYGLER
jgi:hypothetical protein